MKINIIQEKVIRYYSGSYQNTKRRIIDYYKFICPEIENEFLSIGTEINSKLTRKEILDKLVGDNKNLNKFNKYENKLKVYKYLSNENKWLKGSAELSRFYSHCERKTIFKSHFVEDIRGIKYLRDLYDFYYGTNIDIPSKRKLQLTKTKKTEFDFLDLD